MRTNTGISKKTYSHHARRQRQRRCIPPMVIDWLIQFGTTEHQAGGYIVKFFDKLSRKRLLRHIGKEIANKADPYLNAYLVMADERVITVGWRTKRIKRA